MDSITAFAFRYFPLVGRLCFVLGLSQLHCSADELSVSPDSISFSRDLIPLITKAGCNSGACHGAAAGRGYLRLSLFGSRPRDDFESLVHSLDGNFLNAASPADSLLLLKPTEQVEHGGGERIDDSGRAYEALMDWIEHRAPPDLLEPVSDITIFPSSELTLGEGDSQAVSIYAAWRGEVTKTVVPSDAVCVVGAEETSSGSRTSPVTYLHRGDQLLFTGHRAGYWPITIRVGAVAKSLAVWVAPRSEAQVPDRLVASSSSLDKIAIRSGARIGLSPAAPCTPSDLARRLWIDLLQRHPSEKEWDEATREIASGQKAQLVDRLLASAEFSHSAARQIVGWLSQASVAKQQPLVAELTLAIATHLQSNDDVRSLVREMLTVPVSGLSASGLTDFHRLASDPRERTELVAGALMGVQIGCAKCHDHPLDKWTQDDYFAMAACWAPVQVDANVRRVAGRTTTDLRTEQSAVARLPDQAPVLVNTEPDHALIQWLLANDNPYFVNNIVNRTWDWLIGDGLVTPVDDFRSTNPPLSPELLEHLGDELRAANDSLRGLVRAIVLSDSYARRSEKVVSTVAQRLGIARRPKPISVPAERLTRQLFCLPDAYTQASQVDVQMSPSVGSCTRSAACADPLSEGLELVTGTRLSATIHEGVEKAWSEGGKPTATDLLRRLHHRAFGHSANASVQASWTELLLEYPDEDQEQNASTTPGFAANFAGREVVEAVVWGWIVSDKFRSLH